MPISAVANDTIALTFDGDWIGVGFTSDTQGGLADIAIDGQFVQTVDLYSRYDDTVSVYFDGLGAGTHTITITVQGDSHPNSTGDRVYFDFFDVWDGLPVAEGTVEEDNGRLSYAANWERNFNTAASGGAYGASGLNVNSTVWFPFTGDSITYQAWASDNFDEVEIRLDGVSQGQFGLYSVTPTTRTFSFDGLGSGAHVIEMRVYRATAALDAFITPAVGPATEPPAPAPIFRYEEDHPALRYDGYPFRQMPQNWGIPRPTGRAVAVTTPPPTSSATHGASTLRGSGSTSASTAPPVRARPKSSLMACRKASSKPSAGSTM